MVLIISGCVLTASCYVAALVLAYGYIEKEGIIKTASQSDDVISQESFEKIKEFSQKPQQEEDQQKISVDMKQMARLLSMRLMVKNVIINYKTAYDFFTTENVKFIKIPRLQKIRFRV